MTETIFGELVRDWRRATSHLHHHGVNLAVPTPSPQQPQGAPVSLTDVVTAFKTDLEDGEAKIRTVLDQHMPGLVALAEKVENDPLIQAAEAAALPPGARLIVADFISKIAAEFPQPAADPADPAEPAAPAADPPAEAQTPA
ncbi:MAG TPA: hypothetical protein VME40_07430 [Caulobacteraceae bacterium]|nr:hypothetical protein [Caulobacteraceae bacterium]